MTATQVVRTLEAEESAWAALEEAAIQRRNERMKEMGIDRKPYRCTFNKIIVCRIPPPPPKDKTESGLYIPDSAQSDSNITHINRGLLIEAGLSALDDLRSHGILRGDIVTFGTFEGDDKEYALDAEGRSTRKLLTLNAGGLWGSEDLEERLDGPSPSMRIVWTRSSLDDAGTHLILPVY